MQKQADRNLVEVRTNDKDNCKVVEKAQQTGYLEDWVGEIGGMFS